MTLTSIIVLITKIVLAIVPILVALALLFFLWGVASFILNVEDETKRKEGKERMVWGLVALFFIASIGSLIFMLQATFFGSGLHSTTSFGPNYLALPGNSLDSNAPAGQLNSDFNNNLNGGHVSPTGSSGNSFKIVGAGSIIDSSASSGGGIGFRFRTWACSFGVGCR